MVSTIQVVFDCDRPLQLAEFWAAALGYVVQPPAARLRFLAGPAA